MNYFRGTLRNTKQYEITYWDGGVYSTFDVAAEGQVPTVVVCTVTPRGVGHHPYLLTGNQPLFQFLKRCHQGRLKLFRSRETNSVAVNGTN